MGNPYYSQGLGAPVGKIVSNALTGTDGTVAHVTSTNIPITGVWVGADLGNTNHIVVGDSSCEATAGSIKGIILIPGNPSIFLPVNNLNLVYYDVVTTGDRICFAYLQPYC